MKDIAKDSPEQVLKKAYADNFAWLQRYVMQHSGTVEDAQDVFQEGVSVAWLNLAAGRFVGDAEQFNAYVRQICKYKWINVLRSSARTKVVLEDDFSRFEGLRDETESLDEQWEQTRRLRDSFAGIGEKCRELLGRFYFRKQSLADIADAMGNTEESVKTIKYRCMMRLRKIYLEKRGSDG